MTTREMYVNAINLIEGNEDVNVMELRAALIDAINKMDHANEARKVKSAEKAAARQAEKEPIRAALLAVINAADHPMTATELIEAAQLGDAIKGPASIPSLLRPLVEAGNVLKVDVKVVGKGTQRGYVKA